MNSLSITRNVSAVAEESGAINYMHSLPLAFDSLVSLNSSNNTEYLSNILTIAEDSKWSDNKSENKFVSVSFLKHKILLNGYAIKTHEGEGNIRDWELEGSNDGYTWKSIHRQDSDSKFCRKYWTIFFLPLNNIDKAYSHFRLSQKGTNCYSTNNMYLAGIEFYGVITPIYQICPLFTHSLIPNVHIAYFIICIV